MPSVPPVPRCCPSRPVLARSVAMPLPARSLLLLLATTLAAIALARAACPFAALARDGAGESHSRRLAQTGFNPQVGSLRLAEAQLCGRTAANASGPLLRRRPGSPRSPAMNPPSFKPSHRPLPGNAAAVPTRQRPRGSRPSRPERELTERELGRGLACCARRRAAGCAQTALPSSSARPTAVAIARRTLQTNPRCIGGTIEALGAPLACWCHSGMGCII